VKPKYYQEMQEVENEHWWFSARRKYIQILLFRILTRKKNLRICEIGCGTGGNLEMLSAFGRLDAVEMNDYARSIAKKRQIPNVDYIQSGYLPDRIGLAKKYDAVFALDVLEHVENADRAVATLKRLLKEDGILVSTVPAYQWLWSRHDEVNMHYRRYTKRTFNKLFEDEGMNVIYESYFNTLLFPIVAIFRLVGSIFKRKQKFISTDLKIPPPRLNNLLGFIFNIESNWSGITSMPFGLSVISVSKLKRSL
jgi:SAM-dependent methyltransferase